MALQSTLFKSDGVTVLSSTLNPATARQIVANLQASVVTPGVTGYDQIKLLNSTLDTLFQNATAQNPVPLGQDDIYLLSLLYPEVAPGP